MSATSGIVVFWLKSLDFVNVTNASPDRNAARWPQADATTQSVGVILHGLLQP